MRVREAGRGFRTLSRLTLIGMIGSVAAACSTDASRLSDPFTNPFSGPSTTGSLAAGSEEAVTQAPAIRTPRIQSQELAAPGAVMTPRSIPAPGPVAVSGTNPSVSGLNPDAGRAMTPRTAPVAPQPKLTFGQGAKGADKASEAKKIMETEAKKSLKVEQKPDLKADKKAKAEAEAKAVKAEAAKDAAKEAAKKVAEAKAAEAAAKASPKDAKLAAKEPAKDAVKPAEKSAPIKVASADPVAPVAAPESNESFRWPAKGRVINGYGSAGNEGINIAVPEGTPVKAAEDGTVAYAGSDVKGYGKLVLVRHSNGFVSAYAHNGELDVRQGDKVKRGQTIAKSGATGNVTSPQLHFEIRKGATPVDPIPHLASN